MARRRQATWRVMSCDAGCVADISGALGVSELLARVLVNRGVTGSDEAREFLRPSLASLPAPQLMMDMAVGVGRAVRALQAGERIAVYGDYDADGITACALIYQFLREVGADVRYVMPDRMDDGYGLKDDAVRRLHDDGVSLIITVDCGVSDIGPVGLASSLGIDCIVTDHHLPPDMLPGAAAVINPRRTDCGFPYKDLAGVGVAFYFVIALRAAMREQGMLTETTAPNLKSCLDLVAIGTVADMMPLTGPNRVFVRHGLDELATTRRVGLKMLRDALVSPGRLRGGARMISHRIAPYINAPGRMGTALDSLRLLVEEDENSCRALIDRLKQENLRRRAEEERVLQDALVQLRISPSRHIHVLKGNDWHPGVVGVVASRLIDRCGRPVVLLTEHAGKLKGSGRSVIGFNLKDALDELAHLLEAYGGHAMAAGLTIGRDKLDEFRDALDALAGGRSDEMESERIDWIDGELDVAVISDRFFRELAMIEPFGLGNPEPRFIVRGATVERYSTVGSDKHLKLRLRKDGREFGAIGFSMAGHSFDPSCPVDVIGTPKQNEYNGIITWDLHLDDIVQETA